MKCPGQDTLYWKDDAIFEVDCPQCKAQVEFFKDDTTRKCGQCGHRFVNPKMDFGCAAYCQYAEQCLGDLPPELVAQQEELLKDRVAIAVKRHLKSDFKQIGHISRRAQHAEAIAGRGGEVNLPVVLIAALLWDLDGNDTVNEAPLARSLLTQLQAPEPLIEQVCQMIARRGSEPSGPLAAELKIVNDAQAAAIRDKTAKAD